MFSTAVPVSERVEASKARETQKFMQVRLIEAYSDADVERDVQIYAPNSWPITKTVKQPGDFFIKGLSLANTEKPDFRGSLTRTMSVKTIPKGTLLYCYITARPPPEGSSPSQAAHQMFAKLLGSVCLPCTFDNESNEYIFKYAKYYPNNFYYYTVPAAGFGIGGVLIDKNACIAVITQSEIDVAYLKEGGSMNVQTSTSKVKISQSTYPKDLNYRRVRRCPDITSKGTYGALTPYDICLQPDFMIANNLAGYTTIAAEDTIQDYTINDDPSFSYPRYKDEFKNMAVRYSSWLSTIVRNGEPEEDMFMHKMNMLAIESDRIETISDKKLYFGFPEYLINGFGSMNMVEIMNNGSLNDPLISSKNILETDGQTIMMMDVRVHAENIREFVDKFIYPNTAVRPFNLFTVGGAAIDFELDLNSLPTNVAVKPSRLRAGPPNVVRNRIIQRQNYEYLVNNYIAQSLFRMKDILKYDLLKNLILITDYTVSDRNQLITTVKKIDADNNIEPDITKGYYDITIDSIDALLRAQKIKLHHEAMSFLPSTQFRIIFMREYNIKSIEPGSDEIYRIPIGPYYNPLGFETMDDRFSFEEAYLDKVVSMARLDKRNPVDLEKLSSIVTYASNYRRLRSVVVGLEKNQGITASYQTPDMNNMTAFNIYGTLINIISTPPPLHSFGRTNIVDNRKAKTINITGADGIQHYEGPFYNGEWGIAYDTLSRRSGPILPPKGSVSYAIPHSPMPGLPQIGLSLSPSVLPPSPPEIGLSLSPSAPGLKGGRLTKNAPNYIMPLINKRNNRKINNLKARNTRNNRRKNNRANTRKNVGGFKPLDNATVNAYNAAIKLGLLDNFFIKFSGKPLKYKTAN